MGMAVAQPVWAIDSFITCTTHYVFPIVTKQRRMHPHTANICDTIHF